MLHQMQHYRYIIRTGIKPIVQSIKDNLENIIFAGETSHYSSSASFQATVTAFSALQTNFIITLSRESVITRILMPFKSHTTLSYKKTIYIIHLFTAR